MAITSFFKRNWIHFAAIGIFLVIGLIYFSKQLEGYGLKQHDIEQYIGMAHEANTYRDATGEEQLWSNSAFGGMPTVQTAMIHHGNVFGRATAAFLQWFPSPLGVVLLYMVCFYAMLSMMKVNRWVAIIGAIGFAFMSNHIILLQAGHNSKGVAIAFMATVIGAFYMAYRRNWIWGAILSALFMSFEMAANHLQITYYMGFLLLALGIVELVRAIKDKTFANFLKATAGVCAGYVLALMVNYSNVAVTADYADQTIRGANDITIAPDGTSTAANATSGLDRDYVTQWSYGIGESFTLVSPYVKGSSSTPLADSPFADKADNAEVSPKALEQMMGYPVYWGEQPITSGPVYAGVILVLLALLGMVYLKDPIKWALLATTVLTLALSWGKNYMGLTDFFLDNVPGYDKFRAVTIILAIVELCIPLLAILFLDRLVRERESIKQNMKPFLYVAGGFFAFLLIVKVVGIDNSYISKEFDATQRERQVEGFRGQIAQMDPIQFQQQYGVDINNKLQVDKFIEQNMEGYDEMMNGMVQVRKDIFQSSMTRSLIFVFFAAVVLFLFFRTALPTYAALGILGLLIVIDLMGVARTYLNNEDSGSGYRYWEEQLLTRYPTKAEPADLTILEMETKSNPAVAQRVEKGRKEGKALAFELEASGELATRIENASAFMALNSATNYRVFDYSGGFGSARASYFHKSLGGYHGAKLRSIQNLYDFHLSKSNNKVYNMLNVKYFLQPAETGLVASPNPEAMGNGWLVKKVKVYNTANEEINHLGSRFDLKNAGTGKLVVNGAVKTQAAVFGSEKIQYVVPGRKDTLNVPLSNGIQQGMKVLFVMDAKGATNLIPYTTQLADTANSFTQLVEYVVTEEFKPAEEAVIRADEAKKLSQKTYKGEGRVLLTSYSPDKLTYTVSSSDKGLAVFSEIYYKDGWTATVNGKPADIVRLDYLLRGLEVPKGDSKVVFTFDIPRYHSLNKLALVVSIFIILLAVGYGAWTIVKRKPENGAATENQ